MKNKFKFLIFNYLLIQLFLIEGIYSNKYHDISNFCCDKITSYVELHRCKSQILEFITVSKDIPLDYGICCSSNSRPECMYFLCIEITLDYDTYNK